MVKKRPEPVAHEPYTPTFSILQSMYLREYRIRRGLVPGLRKMNALGFRMYALRFRKQEGCKNGITTSYTHAKTID